MYVSKALKRCAMVLSVVMVLSLLSMGGANASMVTGGKFVGNIISGSAPSNFANYWNQVTPENGGKWGSVEGTRGVMNWGQCDTAYNYAKSHGYTFKFHCLVWGSQQPGWISGLSAADQKTEVTDWIKAAGSKYSGADYVDVVNEALHTTPPYANAIGGSGSTGWDWIVWSFQQARAAFPNSKLLINEYGIISDPNEANKYVSIINILKGKGLIDGIGIQCHTFNMDNVSVSTMNQVLGILGATGLPVYVSELDMDSANDSTQQSLYQQKFPVLYESPYVAGITLWGYIQGQTWEDNTWLIRSDGSERPALTWLKSYLAGKNSATPTPTPSLSTPTPTPSIATATPTPGQQSAFSQIEAESYSTQSGIQTESCTEGGQDVGYIENGDYAVYNNIDFGSGAASFQARVASATSGGNIEIRLDSATGTLVGTCPVAGTGDWQTWVTSTCSVSGVTGMHNLYLKFTGGSGYLFNLNWFKFTAGSATSTPTPTPTPTSSTATPTPTPTPTTGTPAPGGIKVQFFNGNAAATTNTIYPNFKVVNTGTSAINLSDVKMRYYFTNDGTQANSFACDYSTIGAGNVTGSFTTIAKTNADRYLEVGFTSAAGTLGAGASAEVKGRIWKSDWSNFTQTNDYSFNATATNYVDSTTVTGYIAGALEWGTEP